METSRSPCCAGTEGRPSRCTDHDDSDALLHIHSCKIQTWQVTVELHMLLIYHNPVLAHPLGRHGLAITAACFFKKLLVVHSAMDATTKLETGAPAIATSGPKDSRRTSVSSPDQLPAIPPKRSKSTSNTRDSQDSTGSINGLVIFLVLVKYLRCVDLSMFFALHPQ